MRFALTVGLIIFAALGASAQVPTITPATPPKVQASATQQFTCTANCGGIAWTCPSCAGSVNSSGLYTAPSTIAAKQSAGGLQLLPNDHIYNTRVDSLGVDANSALWITAAAGLNLIVRETNFPLNYSNGSTPTQSMVFFYTTGNDGLFQIPAYPGIKIEGGWFGSFVGNIDRHLLVIDTTTGTVQESYNYYPPGTSMTCPLCNSTSGIRYASSTYDLPNVQGGSTDAAGLLLTPLILRVQEMVQALATSGSVNHALRFTVGVGPLCGSSTAGACGSNAASTRHIWPATAEAFNGGGVIPYGALFRLKASYNISGFSPAAQIILTTLKNYGMILSDAGTNWAVTMESGKWPASVVAAFAEIGAANISTSNFEAPDISSLFVSDTSGATTASEHVVATNGSGATTRYVVLTGVTVGLPDDIQYYQAGIAARQLTAFVNGGSTNTVTWAMSPTVGTLTSGGLYTPPATLTDATATTVTATSVDDTSVKASMTLVVHPTGIIYARPGATSQYTDAGGHKWEPFGGDSGGIGCCGNISGGSWPMTTDIALYYFQYFAITTDAFFNYYVPNGIYTITGKFGTNGTPGEMIDTLEAQGIVVHTEVDINVSAGGTYKPIDFSLPGVVVNSGVLSFVLRKTDETSTFSIINALKVEKTAELTATQTPRGLQTSRGLQTPRGLQGAR